MTAPDVSAARVDIEIWDKFPTYTAQLVVLSGITNQASNEFSEAVLSSALEQAISRLQQTPLDELPQVKLWRDAFNSFGVKPKDGRSSFEALLRRIDKGLPRINLLTDIYNALSIKHLVPIGGENFDQYQGSPRLVVADGSEPFDTMANGEPVQTNAAIGEVIWRDEIGVTCRRWNWRQCVRTRLTEETTNALFIFDGLGTNSDEETAAAASELIELTSELWPSQKVTKVTLSQNF